MRAAAASSHKAFQTWREISVSTRIRYMFNLQQLVQKNQDELARLIVKEQGKTFADAKVCLSSMRRGSMAAVGRCVPRS